MAASAFLKEGLEVPSLIKVNFGIQLNKTLVQIRCDLHAIIDLINQRIILIMEVCEGRCLR